MITYKDGKIGIDGNPYSEYKNWIKQSINDNLDDDMYAKYKQISESKIADIFNKYYLESKDHEFALYKMYDVLLGTEFTKHW